MSEPTYDRETELLEVDSELADEILSQQENDAFSRGVDEVEDQEVEASPEDDPEEWKPPTREEWEQQQGKTNAFYARLKREQEKQRALEQRLEQFSQHLGQMAPAFEEWYKEHRTEAEKAEDAKRLAQIPSWEEDPRGNLVGSTVAEMEKRLASLIQPLSQRIEEQEKLLQFQALSSQQQAIMGRYQNEVNTARPEEREALDSWRKEYFQGLLADGMDQQEAYQALQYAEGQYFRQAWEAGFTGPGALAAARGVTKPVTRVESEQNGQESSPERLPAVKQGKVPKAVQEHRRRLENAPDGGPRGRAPSEAGDPFKAMASRLATGQVSDDDYTSWTQRLKAQGMSGREIDQRLDDAAEALSGR